MLCTYHRIASDRKGPYLGRLTSPQDTPHNQIQSLPTPASGQRLDNLPKRENLSLRTQLVEAKLKMKYKNLPSKGNKSPK